MIRRLLDVDPDADLKADDDQCTDTNEKEQACPKCGGVMIVVETFKRLLTSRKGRGSSLHESTGSVLASLTRIPAHA